MDYSYCNKYQQLFIMITLTNYSPPFGSPGSVICWKTCRRNAIAMLHVTQKAVANAANNCFYTTKTKAEDTRFA